MGTKKPSPGAPQITRPCDKFLPHAEQMKTVNLPRFHPMNNFQEKHRAKELVIFRESHPLPRVRNQRGPAEAPASSETIRRALQGRPRQSWPEAFICPWPQRCLRFVFSSFPQYIFFDKLAKASSLLKGSKHFSRTGSHPVPYESIN